VSLGGAPSQQYAVLGSRIKHGRTSEIV